MSGRVDASFEKCLRSVLVTCRHGINLRDLEHEYRDQVGESIPYRRLGFESLLDLLASLPHVVRVEEERDAFDNHVVRVHVVNDQRSEHVRNFVLAQKPDGKERKPRFDRPDDPRLHKNAMKTRMVPQVVRDKIEQVLRRSEGWISMSQLDLNYRSRYGSNIEFGVYGFRSLSDMLHSMQVQHFCQMALFNEQWMVRGTTQQSQRREQEQNQSRSSGQLSRHKAKEMKNHSRVALDGEKERNCPPVPKVLRDNLQAIIKKHREGISLEELFKVYKEETHQELSVRGLGYASMDELLWNAGDICRVEIENFNCIVYPPKNLAEDVIIEERSSSSQRSSSQKAINNTQGALRNRVLNNIRKLIESGPISLRGFEASYYERHKEKLSLLDLGFSDLRSFLLTIDFLELHERQVNRQNVVIVKMKSNFDHQERVEECRSPQLLQKGSRDPTHSIPLSRVQKLSHNIKMGDQLKVVVGEIFSPWKFYVILFESENFLKLEDELMPQLQEFYNDKDNLRKFYLKKSEAIPLSYIAALYPSDKRWHRGLIRSVSHVTGNVISLEVMFVDYGSVAKVELADCCVLHSSFTQMPSQAIEAKLGNLRPMSRSSWPEEVSETMLEMCLQDDDGVLEATFQGYCDFSCNSKEQEQVVLSLQLKRVGENVSINDLLVKKGLAATCDESSLHSQLKRDEKLGSHDDRLMTGKPLPKIDLLKLQQQNSDELKNKNEEQKDIDAIILRLRKLEAKQATNIGGKKEEKASGIVDDSTNVSQGVVDIGSVRKPTIVSQSSEIVVKPNWGRKIFRKVSLAPEKNLWVANLNDDYYVTSASISLLVKDFRKRDVLQVLLKRKGCDHKFRRVDVNRESCERLFVEGQTLGVPGVIHGDDAPSGTSTVSLYLMADVPAILRRVTVQDDIKTLCEAVGKELQRLQYSRSTTT